MGILYVVAAVFVVSQLFPLILGPIVVKLSNSVSGRPDIVIIDERELPPQVAYYFRSVRACLDAIGFRLVAYLRIERGSNKIVSFMMYLSNRDTMDLANAVTMFYTGPKAFTVSYFEFCRKFADRSELDTNNSSQPGVFARDAARLLFGFPGTDSPRNPWELHLSWSGRKRSSLGRSCLLKELRSITFAPILGRLSKNSP
jgi:hypothetical protein